MSDTRSPFGATGLVGRRWPALALFTAWLCLVGLGACHHVFWRDEVRALSLALQGDNLTGFFEAIHGEGHPALWYILLRGAYLVVGQRQVLPGVALAIAVAAMLVLVFRAPFKWPLIGLILFSHFALSEYAVVARNYGVSMLVMFAFAALYAGRRRRGVVLGVLLFVLANCNVHSVILAGGFLLLWFIDLLQENGLKWTPEVRVFLVNAVIAGAGVAICALTVFPTFNDAGVGALIHGSPAAVALATLVDPGSQFDELGLPPAVVAHLPSWGTAVVLATQTILSVAMFAAAAGLIRRPGAALAALATLFGLALLFGFGVHGEYRQQALWLVFLIALYWICAEPLGRRQESEPPAEARFGMVVRVGYVAFAGLLAAQAVTGLFDAFDAVHPGVPRSRARDLAQLIESRADLRQAVVIADPDYFVEPLPYYVANPLYLMRERRFGSVVRFSKRSLLTLSLADILDNARRLRAQTGRPVIVLLASRLDQAAANTSTNEGYDWVFTTTPDQTRHFEAATIRLARMGPATTDETYDVYELR